MKNSPSAAPSTGRPPLVNPLQITARGGRAESRESVKSSRRVPSIKRHDLEHGEEAVANVHEIPLFACRFVHVGGYICEDEEGGKERREQRGHFRQDSRHLHDGQLHLVNGEDLDVSRDQAGQRYPLKIHKGEDVKSHASGPGNKIQNGKQYVLVLLILHVDDEIYDEDCVGQKLYHVADYHLQVAGVWGHFWPYQQLEVQHLIDDDNDKCVGNDELKAIVRLHLQGVGELVAQAQALIIILL